MSEALIGAVELPPRRNIGEIFDQVNNRIFSYGRLDGWSGQDKDREAAAYQAGREAVVARLKPGAAEMPLPDPVQPRIFQQMRLEVDGQENYFMPPANIDAIVTLINAYFDQQQEGGGPPNDADRIRTDTGNELKNI